MSEPLLARVTAVLDRLGVSYALQLLAGDDRPALTAEVESRLGPLPIEAHHAWAWIVRGRP